MVANLPKLPLSVPDSLFVLSLGRSENARGGGKKNAFEGNHFASISVHGSNATALTLFLSPLKFF